MPKDREQILEELTPSSDFMFSYILSDKSMSPSILSLVNATRANMNEDPFSDIIDVTSQARLFGKTPVSKYSVLDIVATAQDGTLVDIEMQVRKDDYMEKRLEYYSARLVSKLGSGEDYHKLPGTCMIVIEGLKTDSNSDGRFHHAYDLRSKTPPHEPMPNGWIDIHRLSLTTFLENEKSIFDPNNKLHWWLGYLSGGHKNSEFVKEAGNMDSGILKFAEKYNYSLSDPETFEIYEFIKQGEMEHKSAVYSAEKAGRYDVFRSMYLDKMPQHVIDMAAKSAKVSKEELEQIRKSIQTTKTSPAMPPM